MIGLVYSFDVFDTLITRATATPEGIFALMQIRIKDNSDLDGFVKKNFYRLRIGAEQVARNTYCRDGIEDVTLEQIYEVLVKEHKITKEQSLFLQRLECETEFDHIVGISENILRIKRLLKKSEKVILISDMYLDVNVIRRLLVKVDSIFFDIPLYVSSGPEKKNKYSGNLFRVAKEKEGLQYDKWKHFGDNKYSDYEIPKRLGIECELYQNVRLLEIERAYLKNGEDDPEKQLMIGCSKLARFWGMGDDANILGCTIGGPLLYPYVKWLLEDCLKRGIKRLYFVARDGYILKKMAEQLVEQNNIDIKLYYIYGSRKAWRIPNKDDLQKELIDIYEGAYKDRIFNLTEMADFFQISEERLMEYLPEGLLNTRLVWTIQTSTLLLKYLLGSQVFLKELNKVYDEKRVLLTEYLQQEIDVSDDGFAFVDLAGSGLTQDFLAKVMRLFYSKTIKNYFYRKDCINEFICDFFVFYPNHIPYYVLLEMLCRAPHEQTIGYQKTADGKVIPVFAHVDKEAIIQHRVPNFISGAKKFTMIYDRMLRQNSKCNSTIRCILPYLDYIYHTPDDMILNYFGDMPDMLTGREKRVTYYAPRLTDKEIKDIFWYDNQENIGHFYQGSSFEYSLKRCTKKQKRKIAIYKKLYPTVYGKLCRKIYKNFSMVPNVRVANIYDCIAKHIAVYGAGKVGQRFVRQITGKEKVNGVRYFSKVVLWVDRDYLEYQKKNMMVSSPDEVDKKEYEQLIIAVAKRDVAESIKAFLLRAGVDENKIFWIKE